MKLTDNIDRVFSTAYRFERYHLQIKDEAPFNWCEVVRAPVIWNTAVYNRSAISSEKTACKVCDTNQVELFLSTVAILTNNSADGCLIQLNPALCVLRTPVKPSHIVSFALVWINSNQNYYTIIYLLSS